MITTAFLAVCAVTLAAMRFPRLRQQWCNARDVIEQEREHDRDAIATAVTCQTCADPTGMGPCTCAARCGHRFCRGRRLQATWNDDDPIWAAAMGIDLERTGQR